MAAVQTAMLADLPYPRLRDAILAHPTMAEGLGSLFSNVPSRSVQEVTPKSAVGDKRNSCEPRRSRRAAASTPLILGIFQP